MAAYDFARNIAIEGFGSGAAEVALTGVRIVTGGFFAISGFHKLFFKSRNAVLVKTLIDCGIPFVGFNRWFVPGVELAAGLGLIVGLFTPLAALGLLAICVVASCTDGPRKVHKWKPHLTPLDCVGCYLYLSEIVYILILFYFVVSGAGPWGLDRIVSGLI